MNTCLCMAESFRCSPQTITTLLIGYIPIQNKKLFKRGCKEEIRKNPIENEVEFYKSDHGTQILTESLLWGSILPGFVYTTWFCV